MLKIYLIPVEVVGSARGPKYLKWRFHPGINTQWGAMDYGFVPIMLVVCPNIDLVNHTFLATQIDTWAFPDDLDTPVTDPAIEVFSEGVNIPTDWLTPATTYRELLRQTAGIFQLNQRYSGLSGGGSLFDSVTLEDNYRTLSAQERGWFEQALALSGDSGGVNGNPKLRAVVKRGGDLWAGQTFKIAGVEF